MSCSAAGRPSLLPNPALSAAGDDRGDPADYEQDQADHEDQPGERAEGPLPGRRAAGDRQQEPDHVRRRGQPDEAPAEDHALIHHRSPFRRSWHLLHVPELLEQLTLFLVRLLRYGDLQPREHIALALALQLRRAAALDPQQLAALRPGWNLQRHRTLGCRHLDVRAERRVGKPDRDLDLEVRAAPLVERRIRHMSYDDQIARRSAAVARLALALEPDLRPVLHAGRDLHSVPLRATLAAGAVAARARLLDHGATPVAAGARVRK